jgi:hypothetical protein
METLQLVLVSVFTICLTSWEGIYEEAVSYYQIIYVATCHGEHEACLWQYMFAALVVIHLWQRFLQKYVLLKWIQANTYDIAIMLKPCVDFAKGAAFWTFKFVD